ncbi:CehA/McbA family metallohydrolase [Janthinobacterium agaricidamnosum]|uniref:PHP domain protein n=1 Tax=Janthinobacterium agaricidamnosum NBRC 102515 = DSM 9628 TaxID=1349767 RepID=W0V1K5_9BURK|nr:CehA/McbA family metallohydrolase [Janthinobacterium agaricidamnosum]CDG81475.1 PHP domain protein [Janthinobacterium agaricidamnosum NBRC 102515 = DSM 9628]
MKQFCKMAIFLVLSLPLLAGAAVRLVTGPTPIPDGDARAAGDITVINQKLAFALALASPVPYGVPRGAIVDVAVVNKGKIGRDRAVFADFIPNNWSAWPNTDQKIEILERGPQQVVIRAVRDWGKVTISTTYTLKDQADRVEISTVMTNGGDTELMGLLSGLTYWPKGGFLFGVPGAPASGAAPHALAQRMVAYDEDWSVALHASYFDHVEYGSKDLYQSHTLAPGASRTFSGWLQVGASGDLAPVMRAEIARGQLPAGRLHGLVSGADGKPVQKAVVVVEKSGKPYGWALAPQGRYQLQLPAGDYVFYATAKGYRQTAKQALTVGRDADLTQDFQQLQGPGLLHVAVKGRQSGQPLDARIVIAEGQQPVVEFLGKKTFLTELERKGRADLSLAPGDYVLKVAAGGGFLSEPASIPLHIAAGSEQSVPVALIPFADPAARGWFGADLHHHADQAEAVTPPADLARSQLAAGLDLLFVSDHDTMVNLPALQRIAGRRRMPLIGSMELSASWGHFNAYPLAGGQKLAIDMSTATVEQIFAEARRLGAGIIQVNHPFIPYGYFASVDKQVAPGGWNPGYDVVEINASVPGDDGKVLKKLWDDWNHGRPYYLAGGTDVHDVWNDESGRVRTFAHVDGQLTAASFSAALKAGRAYISHGPLIFPDIMFGEHLSKPPAVLGFEVQALAGIKRVDLIADGVVLDSLSFDEVTRSKRIDFMLAAQSSTAGWYALVVEDRDGRKAYTNPVWVDGEKP